MKQQSVAGIARAVEECGVVGAGGAGFPTHVKLSAAVDVAIVNGAECEPLLASDKYLMEKEPEKILKGLGYIMEATGARRGFIALKMKHSLPFHALSDAVESSGRPDISLFPLGDFYPAGDELILVHEITQRVVPERGIPPQVGCLVENVETTLNICEAVASGKPVTRRFLTCAGEVRSPAVLWAHIGTSFEEIINLCGGPTVEDPVVIEGGPLMGKVRTDLQSPVTKITSGIIVLSRDHEMVRRKTLPVEYIVKQSKAACCQCTYCTELCPRYLLGHDLRPHMIMRQLGYGVDLPSKNVVNALLCSGCGLCEMFACVMGLSPHRINMMIKDKLSARGYMPSFPLRDIPVNEMREYRKIPTERIVERLHLSRYAAKPLMSGVETDPDRVEILLKQHAGSTSVPTVKRGERVREGALIAEIPKETCETGSPGARVHASIDGEVIFTDDERIIIRK